MQSFKYKRYKTTHNCAGVSRTVKSERVKTLEKKYARQIKKIFRHESDASCKNLQLPNNAGKSAYTEARIF